MMIENVLKMRAARQRAEDPLNLRSLPLVTPQEDGWPGIEAALREHRPGGRFPRLLGVSVAAAAALVLTLVVLLGNPEVDPVPLEQPVVAVTEPAESEPAPLREPPLESLIAMSQQLESRLRAYRGQTGDMPADLLVYQVELQDLIVQVDEQLSMNPDSLDLWSQRVNLLLDVNQLYENRLRRNYQQMASL